MDEGVGVVGRPRAAVGWSRTTNQARQDIGTKTAGGMKLPSRPLEL